MLSETQIRNAKPKSKEYALDDGGGLFLFIMPSGSKIWRLRYTIGGKQKRITIGKYPAIATAEAREKCKDFQHQVAHGIDPADGFKVPTFAEIAKEWLEHVLSRSVNTFRAFRKVQHHLERYMFPAIGNKLITEITSFDVLKALRKIETAGKLDTAHDTRSACSRVFRYAVITQRIPFNPVDALVGALAPVRKHHRAALTAPADIAGLLRAMRNYHGTRIVYYALWFSAYTFARPGEVRHAEWKEIAEGTWSIPAEKMKMRRPHIVPLAKQTLELLEELHKLTGKNRYLFPNITGKGCMSDMTINKALKLMGYPPSVMTAHGFRAMASTRLHEAGWRSELIERQLAHVDSNKVRAAYNRAEYLDERRKLMQWWADYLTELEWGE